MRSSKVLLGASVAFGALCWFVFAGARQARALSPGAQAGSSGSFVLTATQGSSYAPTFTGNGVLGVRVPAKGQGYAAGTVPAQSELAGFYAQAPGDVQKRANIPTWSTLTFSDGGTPFSFSSGSTSNWRQSIDLHTGVVTTSLRWSAPDGHVTDISYSLLTDRARQFVGLVRLTLIPQWSGTARVSDVIDGTPATMTTQLSKGWNASLRQDWVVVQTQGTHIAAALASQIGVSSNVKPTVTPTDQGADQSVGQQLDFPVSSGQTYTLTKYVGVESTQFTGAALGAAQAQASSAAATGYDQLRRANDSAWAALWAGRIDVSGDRSLATMVNASEFYLWSSTRQGVNWSVSPAGLSSNGYAGHIFWDAETWMFPSLLAFHPELAAAMSAYRHDRLRQAEEHAVATGYEGARYPWESALDGTEQIPPPFSVNTEGLFEQHITADIALAQWQYYLATGDRRWLAQRGWPVLSGAATFWASRVKRGSDGRYHINGVTGPDEENPDVNDEAYTNAAAATTLEDAISAAHVLGLPVPAAWARIARNLAVRTSRGIHPEFAGYRGQLVKQADVTLLQYPWAYPMPAGVASADINYYVPRTDPTGPSMSDAVNEIDASALGTPGCSSYVYTERSFQPFIRDVFDQFSETRTGGAFTFMTGIGGFLQEFIYGYSGLRFGSQNVQLDPSITSQLPGVVLRGISWHGRRFTIAIGQRRTTVTLQAGPPLAVNTPGGPRVVTKRRALTLPTRRPDLTRTADLVRCGRVSVSSYQPGAPGLAAVDGSPATGWQPASLPATLTTSLTHGPQLMRSAVVRWGQQWPAQPQPNVPPAPGPVITLRPTLYTLQVSSNGTSWRTVRIVSGGGARTVDILRFSAIRARFVRIQIASASRTPMLEEVTVTP